MRDIMLHHDTIAAVATPQGSGGISVIKLSGPDSLALLLPHFHSSRRPPSHPREMIYGKIIRRDVVIDEALVCYMPAPRSYTGEDVVEIQTHGGNAAAAAVLDLLFEQGARPAEPGEFTLRAFLNGKIDLVQAESVRLITEAESAAALSGAEKLLEGSLSRTIDAMVESLTTAAAGIEARIEFGEEYDITGADDGFRDVLHGKIARIDTLLRSFTGARKTLTGFRTVITGDVNVGKSSLFNALLGKKRSIVTARPGTTRDWIEARVEIGGILFTLVDTAGIRDTDDEIERAGVAESRRLVDEADIVIHILDPDDTTPFVPAAACEKTILVRGKADLPGCDAPGAIPVSPLTGAGMDTFTETLVTLARKSISGPAPTVLLLERHRSHLDAAREALARAVSDDSLPEECLILDLNDAIGELNAILGRDVSPDILDTVFAAFCIGK